MIKVSNMSYSFPQKDLYNKVSFTIEDGCHCAFIGTNGTGKSTLADILMHSEDYLYDGKVDIEKNCTIGYVSQFSEPEAIKEKTVYEFISDEFVKMEAKINSLCEKMGDTDDIDRLMEEYQQALDKFNAADGDNYERNIKKQLKVANLLQYETLQVSKLSGGEFKLIQVIKEMLLCPKLMIMDEPDVFLDFTHLIALKKLINSHKGTLLVITHNRYLLNNCFNKILHLENAEIQEFDGNYTEYNFLMLQTKIEMQALAAADIEEIERNKKIVDKLRKEATAIDGASRGRALRARVSLLGRLEARKTKSPFVDIKQPAINFHTEDVLENIDVVELQDYSAGYETTLLENVNLKIHANDKVAIVGENGTGKTTLLRDIFSQAKDSIHIAEGVKMEYLSQIPGETINEEHTIYQDFEEIGYETEKEVTNYLDKFGFLEDMINIRIKTLSGGEKNLLQLAKTAAGDSNLLILDEPTSHLDTYAQIALEEAIKNYNGTVIMVSHDFYTIANSMDYVLLIEDKNIRKISIRKFRKMIYADHFNKEYIELEKQKKDLENKISIALRDNKTDKARALSEELEYIIKSL